MVLDSLLHAGSALWSITPCGRDVLERTIRCETLAEWRVDGLRVLNRRGMVSRLIGSRPFQCRSAVADRNPRGWASEGRAPDLPRRKPPVRDARVAMAGRVRDVFARRALIQGSLHLPSAFFSASGRVTCHAACFARGAGHAASLFAL